MRMLILVGSLIIVGCNNRFVNSEAYASYYCEKNDAATVMLCTKKQEGTSKKSMGFIEYVLVNKAGEELKRGTITNGEIKWLNDRMIEIYETPGNISTELTRDDIAKVYDIESGTFMPKNEWMKKN